MTSTPPITYVLETGTGTPLRFDFSWVSGRISPLELLPDVFFIADTIHEQSVLQLATIGKSIGCGPGCSACCHQLVPVSDYEAVHIAGLVRSMPEPQRTRIIRRFTRITERLEQARLLIPLTETYSRHVTDNKMTSDMKQRYWDLQIPCPFLENDTCSIHPHRPLACRQYSTTSRPALCSDIYTDGQSHEIVVHPFDTGGTLAAFSGEGIRPTQAMPLVFSLLAERGIRKRLKPLLPAHQMMGRFLTLLATCFAHKG